MTTYKIKINKRTVVETADSSVFMGDAESFADSTIETLSKQDIDVSVYLDDVSKHTVTLTDAGATLQFDADLSEGEHTIKVVPSKDPVSYTDVAVDQVLIDDQLIVMTQWDFNNQIYGTTSTLRQLLADPQKGPHQYVWWGTTASTTDSTLNLPGVFYRPRIVSDTQSEWHWTFTKTSSGKIWISNPGDTNDILYDSTASHTYYACQPQQIFMDTATDWGATEEDSSTSPWQGPGTYNATLNYVSNSLDESQETDSLIVLYSQADYFSYKFNSWYHNSYTVTPITVT